MNSSIQLKKAIPLLLVALACFAFSPSTRAVSPAPDGGYANQNTAEGSDALFNLTSGESNTAIGYHALFSATRGGANTANGAYALAGNTTGSRNTANGWQALLHNTTGEDNTANGAFALLNNTTGGANTASGIYALLSNTTGNANTANGQAALLANTTGESNTATGYQALQSNTTGSANTANGLSALSHNTTGDTNTASGYGALLFNTTGENNTASGALALWSNTRGFGNTANGLSALLSNTTGDNNTASGVAALAINTTGSRNTATGKNALLRHITGDSNTANGVDALRNNRYGSDNIALGAAAGYDTTGSNNIDIGNGGVAGESSTIRIGTVGTHTATFIAGIRDAAIGGMEVRVNQNGRLGTVPSSKRFKEVIKPMDKASEAILALKPVTFRYKEEIDPERAPQFGLVAEDVERVNPDLVVRDPDGKVYSVRYDAVNAMLLNEFLKERRKNEEQGATIARLEKRIDALTASLQKVSAQLELSKSAPQTALNKQ